jgi:predicted AlkP superfamily pyrophosphatase or phosphodiesterase
MKTSFPMLLLGVALLINVESVQADGKAEHIVVVVWDGLRPDFVRPQYTPALYEFANRGTFFSKHHSAYITTTEVNGTALATGMQPDHSGVIANHEYRPTWTGRVHSRPRGSTRSGEAIICPADTTLRPPP